jgi:hypothetical protein
MGWAPATAMILLELDRHHGLRHVRSIALLRRRGKDALPQILAVAWGRIEVEGAGTFRDAKLFPGGAREWDWRETGTEHTPGIQPADVRELLDHGATTVVLSQGMLKRLGTCPETIELLKQRRVGVHVLPTQDAVGLYNDLRKTEPVAGLFHTTC